jgi:hypothetical protein
MAKSLSKHGMRGIVLLLFFWTLPASGYEVTNLAQLTNGSIAESGCTFNANGTKIALLLQSRKILCAYPIS